nr:TPA_asm: M52 uORF RNA *3 [Murid betaherpesvirus 1]DBA07792.1 TPA_asm: M52 uORF RNA *3 [Murid betaherpesvirus 1]
MSANVTTRASLTLRKLKSQTLLRSLRRSGKPI